MLTDPEWSALSRFHFEADARREAASRAARRLVIGQILKVDPKEVDFEIGPHGKPEVKEAGKGTGYSAKGSGCSGPAGRIRFSASHSGDWALIGLAREARVGVDVEAVRPMEMKAVAERFFAEEEIRELASLSEGERAAGFFALWTLKESYLKALGRGLSKPLQSFCVRLENGPALVRCTDEPGPWGLASIPFEPGYAAAVAAEGGLKRCRTYSLG